MSRTTLALLGILLLAAGIRLWGLFHDLPFSYFGDELHFMKRSMAMGTGDLNPHWFHKPALPMYLWLLGYGMFFVAGRLVGRFGSTAEFGAYFLTTPGPFLLIGRLVVFAFGVATVWVVYRLARRAFDSEPAGLAAALVAAVLAPMVASSQHMKSDVPGGFFIALSILIYLRTRDDLRWQPFLLAALLAGVAMGAHYYGIVLVPAFGLMELWNGFGHRLPWRTALLRAVLVPAVFIVGFFATSPYNFLDPAWMRANVQQLKHTFFPEPGQVLFEPDSKVEYKPGTSQALGGATLDFLNVLTAQKGLGVPLTVLAVIGLGAALIHRETRWYAALVAIPILIYFLAAITVAAFHVQPRHLNAIYPLLATLVWPGALLLGRRKGIAAALVVLACIPTTIEAAQWNRQINRKDSRLISYRWIVQNLPRDARILLDDEGPPLQPDPRAAARQQELLRTLPKSPFTRAQGQRLALLRRYPPPDAFDIVELGHQWWLPREKSDAELRSTPTDLDMGNPLVSRQPRSMDEYRAEGIRYVVTNSASRSKYFRGRLGEGFPSFVRFYRGLDRERLVRTFDPAAWGGKGPIIWIYDLGER
ncbi:MAG TPA: glycosyltransferase family 39 protein [Thermoanaerobaculia bacterium]|jgi:4-amino-4-deoxy-L-arabinose transferase-like glycosyltransferase|nr:glycosyltransferase family 39 protein [Thermoanaerobaculia bacterium]